MLSGTVTAQSGAGEPLGNLTALQVQAGDWQLDLSRYVANLPVAPPQRITVSTELENDGGFHELPSCHIAERRPALA
jgi:hypothetical protein